MYAHIICDSVGRLCMTPETTEKFDGMVSDYN